MEVKVDIACSKDCWERSMLLITLLDKVTPSMLWSDIITSSHISLTWWLQQVELPSQTAKVMFLSLFGLFLSVRLSVCLSVRPSVRPSSVCLPVCLSVCLLDKIWEMFQGMWNMIQGTIGTIRWCSGTPSGCRVVLQIIRIVWPLYKEQFRTCCGSPFAIES